MRVCLKQGALLLRSEIFSHLHARHAFAGPQHVLAVFDDFISKGRLGGHGGDGRNDFEVSQPVLYRDPLDLVFRS